MTIHDIREPARVVCGRGNWTSLLSIPRPLGTCDMHILCQCQDREIDALVERIGLETPRCVVEQTPALRALALELGHTKPWSREAVISRYSGAKRQRYEKAAETLTFSPLSKKDYRLKAFVKKEKRDELKCARLIQARSLRYNIEFNRYFLPIEHAALGLNGGLFVGRPVLKGLNLVQRAEDLLVHYRASKFFILFDISKMDSSYSKQAFNHLDKLYLSCCNDPYFRKMLRGRRVSHGTTFGGVAYTTWHKRASGDGDTGGGNTLMVLLILLDLYIMIGERPNFTDDGDDGAGFFTLDWVTPELLVWQFRRFGFVLKASQKLTRLEDLCVCQHKVALYPRAHMLRDPWKALSRDLCNVSYLPTYQDRRDWLYSVAQGYSVLYRNLPVLHEWAQVMLRSSVGGRARPELIEKVNYLRQSPVSFVPPLDDKYRVQYCNLWNIPCAMQLELEAALRTVTIDVSRTTSLKVESLDHVHPDRLDLVRAKFGAGCP